MQTIESKKISRAAAENIAKALRSNGENVTAASDYDIIELLAASHPLNEEMRGRRPDSTTGRRDAYLAYIRKLPRDASEALLQVKKDAAEALNEPELLESFERATALRRSAAESESKADRIEQEASMRRQQEAARIAGDMKKQKETEAWSRNWPAEIAAKKADIERLFTARVHNWESQKLASELRAAQTDLMHLKQLQEIAEEMEKRS